MPAFAPETFVHAPNKRTQGKPAASPVALIGAAQSTIAIKIPIIASERMITSKSIVSHWGIRFAGCEVIA